MPEEANNTEVEALEQQLLVKVPVDGSSVGNTDLRRRLATEGWTDEQYWTVRDRLVNRGILDTGRGRGGSVHRVFLATGAGDEDEEVQAAQQLQERDLYAPMCEQISTPWARHRGLSHSYAWITASQGRRETGGRWTRPDITLVARRKFPYYPVVVHDVITFEIKPVHRVDLTAVYEALAHRRVATYAYVLVHIPADQRGSLDEALDVLAAAARRHGIGLVVAEEPGDFSTWEEVVEAERHDADPKGVSDFLKVQAQASVEVAEHIHDVFS